MSLDPQPLPRAEPSPYIADLQANIKAAETEAARGCGLSDVLFEDRVQAAYAGILDRAPESDRAHALVVLRKRGYQENFQRYVPRDGECSLTGIDEHWCPCGRHE